MEELNPLSGFYAAVTRLSPSGISPHGSDGWSAWLFLLSLESNGGIRFPEQRLTREEALRGIFITFENNCLGSNVLLSIGMTIDPAYSSFTESTLGSLVPGKSADFVVLSQDIMSVPANQILNTKVSATVIDGQPIYGAI